MKILVAGFGNVLREDDGVGVAIVQALGRRPELPARVTVLEVGIGGISMVQELLAGYDALIVLDALDGPEPGTVKVLEPDVPDTADLPPDFLADTHYAEPGRAMVLAKAVGALPANTYIVGCVAATSELGEAMSPRVAAAVDAGVDTALELIAALSRSPALRAVDDRLTTGGDVP